MAKTGFEGMDSEDDYHLNEQQDKQRVRRDSLIWIAIAVVAAGFLIWNIYEHYQERQIIQQCASSQGTYHAASGQVWYEDDTGKMYKFTVSDDQNLKDEEKITVYYQRENPTVAALATTSRYWILAYCVLSVVIAGSVFMTVRTIRKG